MNQIGHLAKELLDYNFDYLDASDKDAELLHISGSLSGKLGELNILTNQSFRFTGGDGNPDPKLHIEEGEILQELYLRDYNRKQAQKILRGIYQPGSVSGVTGDSGWIELREGDTVIKRSPSTIPASASSNTSVAKEFKALSDESKDRIRDLVYKYNMYGAAPRQVAGFDAPLPVCEEPVSSIEPSGLISGSGISGSGISGSGIL